jgi:hypothetical protein
MVALKQAVAVLVCVGAGCLSTDDRHDASESEEESAAAPGAVTQESDSSSDPRNVDAEAQVVATSFTGTCDPHKGNTAGWANCTGSGTVRLVIDCTAPQISDFVGSWVTFSGSVTLSGECVFGINRVFVQIQ